MFELHSRQICGAELCVLLVRLFWRLREPSLELLIAHKGIHFSFSLSGKITVQHQPATFVLFVVIADIAPSYQQCGDDELF